MLGKHTFFGALGASFFGASSGIRVQCWWVRQTLQAVDFIGQSLRHRCAIRHHIYNVMSWHLL